MIRTYAGTTVKDTTQLIGLVQASKIGEKVKIGVGAKAQR